jgi:UDP-N-acetylmuramoylalanine--D-glutamate ligase
MSERALVYGAAIAGLATLRALVARGYDVVVVDDHVSPEKSAAVSGIGTTLLERPSSAELAALVGSCDFVAPSPGIPETHPVVVEARSQDVPLRSELDLGYEWESARVGGPRPMVAVTGTDGKTTTVLMTEAILDRAGRTPVSCGNTEIPFVEALDLEVDAFVIEATSFRLAFVESFRCNASAWLNLAPDHLDWHTSMDSYESAKARIWANVTDGDAAIGYANDPIVMRNLERLSCRTFTVGAQTSAYRVEDGHLVSPHGSILECSRLYRSLPHDQINALAAAAVAMEGGLARPDAVAAALSAFQGPHHRIEFVAEVEGVRYFNDSKATSPHAALTAMRGFDSIVLIAGGRNKGLDLGAMSQEAHRLRGAVLIGESADELSRVLAGACPVDSADSMRDAVLKASHLAQSGDVVLLSPGCTSLDWYGGYAQRGDDFARCVEEISGQMRSDELEARP